MQFYKLLLLIDITSKFLKLIQSALLELDLKLNARDFPGGLVLKTFAFQSRRVQVQSWVGELRSHMPCQKTKTWIRSSIVTNSIKTLKMAHIKKKKS